MTGRLRRDESGVFLVMWALLLVALLTMVAIVIDLGRLRDTKRSAQRTVDLAAVAGGERVAGGDIVNGCIAAVRYVASNTPDLSSLTETCTAAFNAACDPTLPAGHTREMVTTSGPYVVTIRNPIPDAELEDPNYQSALGAGTLPDDGLACERMRVTVQRTNDALFAGVVGTSSLTTRATAVIRGFIGTNDKQNAGLVVLERKDCEALVVTGGLASVFVKGSIGADGKPRPGTIQVDTKALEPSAGNCSNAGGNPTNKYAVYGTALNPSADRPGKPAIEAEAIGGAPGRLDMYALTVDRLSIHSAYNPPTGVSPVPTPGVIASRRIVDDVYNAPVGAGAGRVTQLKADSQSLLIALADAVALCSVCNVVSAGGELWHVYPPGTPGAPDLNGENPITPPAGTQPPACTGSTTLIDVRAAYPNVYVNCATLDVPNVRFSGDRVALKGMLKVGSGGMAQFPNASEVMVYGCGGCTGGNKVAIDVGGAFLVNTGPLTPLTKECNDGVDNADADTKADYHATPGVGDSGCLDAADWDELSCIEDRSVTSLTPPSRLVVATGPIETSSSAIVEMCQTFALMAHGNSLPSENSDPSTDTTCAGYTDPSGAVVEQPCPTDNASLGYKGYIKTFGLIDWTAPDQTDGPRDTSLANQRFEDLALWTETSMQSEIKGAGNTITGGVFFFPNALMRFTGQASQYIDLNAQFIARRLEVSGQGTLSMKPNPNDVVETPSPYFRLIR